MAPLVVAEFLATAALRANAISLPWLAHLATGAGIAWAFAFVVHRNSPAALFAEPFGPVNKEPEFTDLTG